MPQDSDGAGARGLHVDERRASSAEKLREIAAFLRVIHRKHTALGQGAERLPIIAEKLYGKNFDSAEVLDRAGLVLAQDQREGVGLGRQRARDEEGEGHRAQHAQLRYYACVSGGNRIGRYRAIARIGEGGSAEVWRGEVDDGFARPVALKRLRPALASSAEIRAAFIAESAIARSLHHGNIVQVHDSFEDEDGLPCLVTELVDGATVHDLLEASGGEPLPLPAALYIVDQVSAALDYAHSLGTSAIIHRDVNPKNILVSRQGVVKLADFGIAKSLGIAGDTLPGTIKGTLAYLSPEQALGEPVDARSDQYSLALVLRELLSGENPLAKAGDLNALLSLLERGLPPLSGEDCDAQLSAIVHRALARRPGHRFPSVAHLRHALDEWRVERGLRLTHTELGARVRSVLGESESRRALDLSAACPPARDATRSKVVRPERLAGRKTALGAGAMVAIALSAALWLRGRGSEVEAVPAGTPMGRSKHLDAASRVTIAALARDAGAPPAPPTDAGLGAKRPSAKSAPRVRRAPAALPVGTLRINLMPWARVRVNGVSRGRTPLVLRLTPGTHTIELSNPNTQHRQTRRVTVEAGEASVLTRWQSP